MLIFQERYELRTKKLREFATASCQETEGNQTAASNHGEDKEFAGIKRQPSPSICGIYIATCHFYQPLPCHISMLTPRPACSATPSDNAPGSCLYVSRPSNSAQLIHVGRGFCASHFIHTPSFHTPASQRAH